MEEFAKELGLEYVELELLKMIHPIFDVNMTRKEACDILGISVPTGRRIWNSMIERYPALAESMKKWDNPLEIERCKVRGAKRLGDLSGIETDGNNEYLYGDKIVRKF